MLPLPQSDGHTEENSDDSESDSDSESDDEITDSVSKTMANGKRRGLGEEWEDLAGRSKVPKASHA